jgi:hypothetical protein
MFFNWWHHICKYEFKILKNKTCCSCKIFIQNENGLIIPRYKTEMGGNQKQINSYYMCEKCGEIFCRLDLEGYCVDITHNMNKYYEMYEKIKESE